MKTMNTKLLGCLALICFLIQPNISSAEAEPCKGSSVLDIANNSLTVEVAGDERSRRYGLMFRKTMGENCGMLFVYQNNRPRTFTMRNTLIALDIAFITEDGTISEVKTMQPGVDHYQSTVDATYALEVNAGWFEKNNLAVGTQIKFKTGEALQPLSSLSSD